MRVDVPVLKVMELGLNRIFESPSARGVIVMTPVRGAEVMVMVKVPPLTLVSAAVET